MLNQDKQILQSIFTILNNKGAFQPATNYWRAYEIAEVLKSSKFEHLGIDIGCGDGLIMEILQQKHGEPFKIHGIDLDPQEAELANARTVYEKVTVCPADQLDYESRYFDFAFSNSVLEHIPDIKPVLAEISRILKPSGLMIITTPNHLFHQMLRGPLIPFFNREHYLSKIDKRCAHLRYWNKEQWNKALLNAGMKLELCTAYLTENQTKTWENLARFTSGILYSIFGEKFQPIDIQRKILGRSDSPSAIKTLVTQILSTILFYRTQKARPQAGSNYLIVARKI